MTTIVGLRNAFEEIVRQRDLMAHRVEVVVRPLTAEQAIGHPDRDDFPLQKGRERIIEANFEGSLGQAFTDSFSDYRGDLASLLALDLNDRFNASLFIAASNSVLRHLSLVERTVHCRDGEPSLCAPQLVDYLTKTHSGASKVTLVGLQPAMAQVLAKHYALTILDLDQANIGRTVAGILVRDGNKDLAQALAGSDLAVCTGSTLCNGTIDRVQQKAGYRPLLFFGITITGAAQLLGLERFCPLGH